jgi:hypothetical protein
MRGQRGAKRTEFRPTKKRKNFSGAKTLFRNRANVRSAVGGRTNYTKVRKPPRGEF